MPSKLQMSLFTFIIFLAAALFIVSTWDQKYSLSVSRPHVKNHLTLNILLHHLRKECMTKNYDEASNTILDIRQEWSYLDATMQKDISYFPSDSIQVLDSLITQLSLQQENPNLMRLILKEINRVNQKLDQLAK